MLSDVADRFCGLSRPLDTAGAPVDEAALRRCLAHAWGTELLQAIATRQFHDEDELVRLSNTWGAVQTYYVGYHATQSLWVAKGNDRPTTHPKTQQIHCDLWVTTSSSLTPWAFAVGAAGVLNAPAGVTIDPDIHTWATCNRESCWSLAALVLRTTRNEALRERRHTRRESKRKDKRKAWLADEVERRSAGRRPRKEPTFALPMLSAPEKEALNAKLRAFTMLDYLFRVRIKTNYQDSAMFTDGPGTDRTTSARVATHLTSVAAATLLAHEARVADLVGWPMFLDWMDDWIERCIPSEFEVGAAMRRHLYPL